MQKRNELDHTKSSLKQISLIEEFMLSSTNDKLMQTLVQNNLIQDTSILVNDLYLSTSLDKCFEMNEN